MRPTKRRPLKNESDNQLMLKIVSNHSEEAFTELHTRYNWRLREYLRHKHASMNDVDDISQLTWLRLFNKSPKLYDPSKNAFRGWLFQIATSVARNYYRDQMVEKRGGGIDHHPLHEIPEEFGEPFTEHNLEFCVPECIKLVRKAVDRLTPSQRTLVTLVYLRDFPQVRAAMILGLSPQTVGKTIIRARSTLQQLLSEIKP